MPATPALIAIAVVLLVVLIAYSIYYLVTQLREAEELRCEEFSTECLSRMVEGLFRFFWATMLFLAIALVIVVAAVALILLAHSDVR